MKLIAAIAVASALLISDSATEPTGPQFQGKYEPVPYPVPEGYQRCIQVVAYPEHRKDIGLFSSFAPPLRAIDVSIINLVIEDKLGRVSHCQHQGA